jgi:hypothetical protein
MILGQLAKSAGRGMRNRLMRGRHKHTKIRTYPWICIGCRRECYDNPVVPTVGPDLQGLH